MEVEVGWEVFVQEGEPALGAIREVTPDRLVIYIENGGDVSITPDQVRRTHDKKVILDVARLPSDVRALLRHAHDRET